MRHLKLIVALCGIFVLTGCVEIIDDLHLNMDGSGTFKYTINLSSSKVKINSILSLDSINGKRVPSMPEIKSKIQRFETQLSEETGISNVTIASDYTNFIFRLSCDFASLGDLQNAIKTIASQEVDHKDLPEFDHNWLLFQNNVLERSVPELTIQKSKEIKSQDRELLKQGSYTSITRFEREIESYDNPSAKLSANKRAIMIRTNPYDLTQNAQLLDNTIKLKK